MFFDPIYAIKDNAIEPDLCDFILQNKDKYGMNEGDDWQEAMIGDYEVAYGDRDSSIKWIPSTHWITAILAVEAARCNVEYWNFRITANEDTQFTKYLKGQHHAWHCDERPKHTDDVVRKLTLTLQLSKPEDYEGGDMEFRPPDLMSPDFVGDGLDIKPEDRELMRQQGTMIIFPSVFTHRITEITKGERYSFVSWANGPNYI